MLRLTRVEMIGFKSFCDKAEILFSDSNGVTAIVGPNGCGKSNIADAISWVLGEQSVKSLRGSSMEDVIFNGTRDRQPLGLAQVSLTLLDPEFIRESEVPTFEAVQENLLPEETNVITAESATKAGKGRGKKKVELKPGEIVVTRKLYRSGESEYYLNGRTCRLRDIQELFMGTGLGPNSYAIIEQGRIGQILSSKPNDRRMLIEEAAGTTKYKAKRKLAEAKLELAKLNLSRVNDIIEEVTRQLNSLKRQASKARRYKELREELREKLTSILFSKLVGLDALLEHTRQELAEASAKSVAAHQELQSLEGEQLAAQRHSFELEDLLRQRRESLSQTHLELDRAQNKIVYGQEQMETLEQRLLEMEGEAKALAVQIETLGNEIRLRQGDDGRLQEELHAIEGEVAGRIAQAAVCSEQLQKQERSLDQLRTQILEAVQRAAALNNQITQIDEGDARLAAQQERQQRELTTAQVEGNRLREDHENLLQAVEGERAELEQVILEIGKHAEELEGTRAREAEGQQRLESLKQQQADAQARQHSIEEMVMHHAYMDEGVQKLLTSNRTSFQSAWAPLGVLADFVDVDTEFEQAIEELLKDELEFIVVESSNAARQGIHLLCAQTGGRSTFVVDRMEIRNAPRDADRQREVLSRPGVLGTVTSKVRLQGRLAHASERILPSLANSFLVDSFETADRLASQFPHSVFVTREGEVFRGCWIRGGRKSASGPLSLKRELRTLVAALKECEIARSTEEERCRQLRSRAAEIDAELAASNGRRIELEKRRVASDHQLKQCEADVARAQQTMAVLTAEVSRLQSERGDAHEAQEAAKRELQELEIQKQSIDATMLHESEAIRDLKEKLDLWSTEISEWKANVATLTERKQSSQEALERLLCQQDELRQRVERIRQQQTSMHEQQDTLRSAQSEIQLEIEGLSTCKVELEKTIAESTRGAETLRARLIEMEDRLKYQRELMSQWMEARSAIEVSLAKQESELGHVRQSCAQELDRTWEELRLLQVLPLEGEALQAAEEEQAQLRQKIDAMGAINMMALEEYAECEQRHLFLDTQRKDLLDSIADTTETIQEIDVVSRQQFLEAFNAINEFFQESFRQLFGGGYGAMKLTDETDLQQSGIDIVAQPPGKKLQNVLLLSGGEKALTAIALLLAIFRYQPSPFCVLDEVDAPLDEANVERFSRMIAQLSGDTHFIVITHNKKTMEIARSMYGVTMQEAGVSKLVSVEFN